MNQPAPLLIGISLLLSSPASSATPPPAESPGKRLDGSASVRPGKVMPHPTKVYHGLYNIADVPEGYAEMTKESMGLHPGIVFTFHDWNAAGIDSEQVVLQTFNDPMEGDTKSILEFAEEISADGAVVAVAWDAITYLVAHPDFDYMPGGPNTPITFAEIFNGNYDDYIRECAHQIKKFAKPIMLSVTGEYNAIGFVSFGPEGNQYILTTDHDDLNGFYGDPAVPDGPERVRDYHRHVIDIFNEEGVENVTWFMYSHSGYMNPLEFDSDEEVVRQAVHPRHYYPGDEYIDWMGNSAYVSNDDPAKDLQYALGAVIEAFEGMGVDKPWFIPEFGVEEDGTDTRAMRITRLLLEEVPAFPQIKAWTFADAPLFEVYFNIPDLGAGQGEIEAWNIALHKLGYYTNRLRIRR